MKIFAYLRNRITNKFHYLHSIIYKLNTDNKNEKSFFYYPVYHYEYCGSIRTKGSHNRRRKC